MSRLAYDWSLLFRRLSGLWNLEYIKTDFYSHDLSGADAVVMYLTAYDMGRMGEKLNKELKTGTLVTSNRFALTGWTPVRSVDVKTLYPHQKTFHVYRKA